MDDRRRTKNYHKSSPSCHYVTGELKIKYVEERSNVRLDEHFIVFYNKFIRFNNTGALMLVSSYDIKINHFEIAFLCKNVNILSLLIKFCYAPHYIKLLNKIM